MAENRITVPLTDEDHRLFEYAAGRIGLTPDEFAAFLVERHVQKLPTDNGSGNGAAG
jgi:hypothetical protein